MCALNYCLECNINSFNINLYYTLDSGLKCIQFAAENTNQQRIKRMVITNRNVCTPTAFLCHFLQKKTF